MKRIIQASLTAFLLLWNVCYGQQVVSSAGGEHSVGSISLSYTIGESVIETVGQEQILTQGFQQSKLTISGIYSYRLLEQPFSVYPNPAICEVNISVENEPENFNIVILNDVGQILLNEDKLIGKIPTIIDFSDHKPGIYFIRIMRGKALILQTFKIIKI